MPERPNILWLMADEQRADSMSYSGTPWAHTPYLDRVARAGTRFSAAYTRKRLHLFRRSGRLSSCSLAHHRVVVGQKHSYLMRHDIVLCYLYLFTSGWETFKKPSAPSGYSLDPGWEKIRTYRSMP